MSLEEKIQNAKKTDWLSEGFSKRKVKCIVLFAKLFAKIRLKFIRWKE